MDREESTNSSEESSDHHHDQAGVGRSYECVFCKRGFNTAQALGGHMNIHRKDRARNKPKQQLPRHHHIPSSEIPQHPYATYFPPADPTNSSTLHQLSNSAVDWRMRFSLEFAPSIVVEGDPRGIQQEKELDLELRLGYHS